MNQLNRGSLDRREFLKRSTAFASLCAAGALPARLGRAETTLEGASRWVVLITIDTLRADHCSVFGYPRSTTPFLERLAENGTKFERCYSTTGTTYPSHTSIFTGLDLPQHGVMANRSPDFTHEAVTMASLFAGQGYKTAAFVSAPFLTKISVGFQHFDANLKDEAIPYRWSEDTIGAAMAYLEKQPADEPLFLWVHLFDPHEWMSAKEPQGLLECMQVDAEEQERLFTYWTEVQKKELRVDQTCVSAMRYGRRDYFIEKNLQYDSRIRYTDDWVSKLFEVVEAQAPKDGALWLVTADHGEALGCHHYDQHARYLYNDIIHVPLIAYASNGGLAGNAVSQPVRHPDIWATLAALQGWKTPDGHPARHGVPLFHADGSVNGGLGDRRMFAQRQVKHPEYKTSLSWVDDFVYCLHDETYKYIINGDGNDELYRLIDDPMERVNLVAELTAEAEAWRAEAAKRREELVTGSFAAGENAAAPSAEEEEILRSLGYI